jgi:hypothetical protein
MWLSLPPEVVVHVFRRLDAADVVSCAGACKTWRRAIIDNASSLRPRPDRFNPNLLLGLVHYRCGGAFLRRVPGPFRSALPASTGGDERPGALIPAAASAGGVDPTALYNWPLSSRDGFLLLGSLDRDVVVGLCLCNPMTGDCRLLPAAAAFRQDAYVLVTGYDDLSPSPSESDDMAVRIQIVAVRRDYSDGSRALQYQHFSSTSSSSGIGSWGPVKRSPEFVERFGMTISPGREVVCGGAIYWLGDSTNCIQPHYSIVAAMDVRTGRTWTIKLPTECWTRCHREWQVLATTSDGRLSSLRGSKDYIQVWVHTKGARWFLQRKIHVPNLRLRNEYMFFPRSGLLLVEEEDGGPELLVDVETGRIMCPHANVLNQGVGSLLCPYEMDWSTFLSKMNPFVTAATARISSDKPMKRRAWRPNPKIYGANWFNSDSD